MGNRGILTVPHRLDGPELATETGPRVCEYVGVTATTADNDARPAIPDGFVIVVKQDCPTCVLVAPVLIELGFGDQAVTVYSQDDANFPVAAEWVINDTDLAMSWHHEIETVPTVLRVSNGVETDRIVGWSASQWRTFFDKPTLGEDITDYAPGCGSLSVDPSRTDALLALYGGTGLASRRVEFAELEDESEALFDRGWTDGLPIVAPTETRVARMLEGTTRHADDMVAIIPPNLIECSVEKVAINAVMAGCKPEYFPVVLTALEAVCTDEFNMHGVLATTMGVGPIFIINGPIRDQIGLNSGINVFGQGNRANMTIGRAVQLVVKNVGGGEPGGIDRATHGSPSKLGFCFAEDEEGSAWEPLSVERGFDEGVNTVTAYCGEGPHIVIDQTSRTPESLAKLLAMSLLNANGPRTFLGIDAMLVVSPEHMSRFADAGWSKARLREELDKYLTVDGATVARGVDGIEDGVPDIFAEGPVPKFNPDGGLHIVHAGGPAGLWSAIIGGWVTGQKGSITTTREITP